MISCLHVKSLTFILFFLAECRGKGVEIDDKASSKEDVDVEERAEIGRELKLRHTNIPNRLQWDCNYSNSACCSSNCNNAICDGHCGSTTLQEALLCYEGHASQSLIRRLLAFNDNDSAQDILIDTDRPNKKPDLSLTARTLGLDKKEWHAKFQNESGLKKFVKFVKNQLKLDAPVAIGVIFQGSYESTYDHIVTAVRGVKNGIRFNDHCTANKTIVTKYII